MGRHFIGFLAEVRSKHEETGKGMRLFEFLNGVLIIHNFLRFEITDY